LLSGNNAFAECKYDIILNASGAYSRCRIEIDNVIQKLLPLTESDCKLYCPHQGVLDSKNYEELLKSYENLLHEIKKLNPRYYGCIDQSRVRPRRPLSFDSDSEDETPLNEEEEKILESLFSKGDPGIYSKKGVKFLIIDNNKYDVSAQGIADVLKQRFNDPRKIIKLLHGSQFFHGSSSTSLLAFTPYGNKEGRLIPIGQMEKEGKIPFGGEIVFGRSGVNQHSLSTVSVRDLKVALVYAYQNFRWNPEMEKKRIEENRTLLSRVHEDVLAKNGREVSEQRFKQWDNLSALEKELVSHPFSVLYGLKPKRPDVYQVVRGAVVKNEILIKDGVTADEISVIYVPKENINVTKQILKLGGHSEILVQAIDPLWNDIPEMDLTLE
jgi:hypothetical protein